MQARCPRRTLNFVPQDIDPISQLPDDAQLLKQQLRASASEVQRLKLMVDKLKLQLARRVRAQFGVSSERFDLQASLIEPVVLEELPVRKPATPAANDGSVDRSLPAHLPREQQEIRPGTTAAHHDAAGQSCGCAACGGRLRSIGADVSEHLEYVPARFKVIRTVRPKLACTKCEAIFQASAPSRPIARGLAGPAQLAHVTVSKYCDHAPLHRQSRVYAREGVEIDPSTMAGWIEQAQPVRPSRRRAGPARAAWRQGARRRHASQGAGAGRRQDAHRPALGLCAR